MASLAQLNAAPRTEFIARLGHLFEHSPWVAADAWVRRPFRDAAHLEAELIAAMRAAPPDRQLELIRAHPDLAGRLAAAGQLTAESTREQASAGLDRLSPAELAGFQELNQRYRDKFGFPFVICARLNARDAIAAALRARLQHSALQEREAALAEIEQIAALRLRDVLAREA